MSELTPKKFPYQFVFLFRFVLGLVFLYASFGKILDPKSFAQNIMNYQLFSSPTAVKYVAVTFPWIEWFCGIFLILGVFVRSVSILSTGLLLLFVGAMASAMRRGLEINCGCFGSAHEVISPFTLLRDSFFLLMSVSVTLSKVDPLTMQSFITSRKQHQS